MELELLLIFEAMLRLLVFFLIGSHFALCQGIDSAEFVLSGKLKRGFLAAHRPTMAHLPKESITAFEVAIMKRVGGNRNWHDTYRKPLIGLTLYGSNLGNKAVLGNGFGAYATIAFPFSNLKRHTMYSTLGCGLGYVTKVFDQEKNPKNVAIGTHFNTIICLGIRGNILLSRKDRLFYSFDITHFSNGAYRVPNLGLNMFFIGLGYGRVVGYQHVSKSVDTLPKVKSPFFKKWVFSPVAILSVKETYPSNRGGKPVYALSLVGRKLFRPKVGMECALDIISKQILFNYRPYIPKNQWKILQIGGYVGYVLPLDRLHLIVGMGMYIKDRYNPDDGIYHRVGMKYHFDNGVTANLVLKSHWAKADYVEYGVGYTFNRKKK